MNPVRYHRLVITLHWVMATAFFLMLGSGLAMVNLTLDPALQFQLYQWHKGLGVLLLLAFFLRLTVRLLSSAPPQKYRAAKAGHAALYIWMLALPLSGWVMVSASPYGLPTIVFDLFTWPHLPGLAANTRVENLSKEIHEMLAYTFIALIAVHIGAVIKHRIVDRENLLPRIGIGAVMLLVAGTAFARPYTVDYGQSRITFSGTHAGKPFNGAFEKWAAEISFDPAKLPESRITVTVDTASAKTGNAMYDGTLPTADWFDVKKHPQARFVSNTIAAEPEGRYTVNGVLAIRNTSVPVKFAFSPGDLNASPVKTSFTMILDRLAFGIGQKSDPGAKWVSQSIPLDITLVAKPQ